MTRRRRLIRRFAAALTGALGLAVTLAAGAQDLDFSRVRARTQPIVIIDYNDTVIGRFVGASYPIDTVGGKTPLVGAELDVDGTPSIIYFFPFGNGATLQGAWGGALSATPDCAPPWYVTAGAGAAPPAGIALATFVQTLTNTYVVSSNRRIEPGKLTGTYYSPSKSGCTATTVTNTFAYEPGTVVDVTGRFVLDHPFRVR